VHASSHCSRKRPHAAGRVRLALSFQPCARAALAACLLAAATPGAAQHIVHEAPLSPAEEQKQFEVPPGFEVQLVAAEPDIAKPINLNFDSQGRLYVTQSIEYPYAAEPGKGRDAVMRLTIDPETGRARKIERLVDRLNIPIGVVPVPRGVIVFTIPRILLCLDTDEDGKIDDRKVLYEGFGRVDTHGLNNGFTRWLDGWIYACHGFRNTSEIAGGDGHQVVMQSGNTYRFRLDGSRVEQFTHGQVNPFGLCFDSRGNVYTADCHSKPAYLLLRGAYYPSFGKPHDGLGFGPMLVEHSHGSTGIAGIAYYEAEQFPAEYRGTIFIGNPITRRINRDRLQPRGSGYRGLERPDFLVSHDKWFRPVDLQLGPDGALYVADFYNRIIGHYEVPLDHPGRDRRRGRIWRIVYRGGQDTTRAEIPNLADSSLAMLVDRLADSNIRRRTLATAELIDRFGQKAIEPVEELLQSEDAAAAAQAHGLWIVERLQSLDTSQIQQAARSPHAVVRVHLLKVLAERESLDAALVELVRENLSDRDPVVRRAAAEALARHPRFDSIEPLLKLWGDTDADDLHLIHTVRMSLRDQLLADDHFARLDLERLAAAGHTQRLQNLCLGIRQPSSAAFLLRSLQEKREMPRRAELLHFVIRWLDEDRLPAAYRYVDTFRAAPHDRQRRVLATVHRALSERGRKLLKPQRQWAVELARKGLQDEDARSQVASIRFAGDLNLDELYSSMLPVALEPEANEEQRGAALEACVQIDPARSIEPTAEVLADVESSLPLRQRAAEALGQIDREAAEAHLLAQLRVAPRSLARTIAASLAARRRGAEKLLAAIRAGKASPWLLREPGVVNRLRGARVPGLQGKIQRLTAGLPQQDESRQKLLAELKQQFRTSEVDLAAGRRLFEKHCAGCHRLQGKGKKIGPELDGIGNRGLDRVLEDVLDPSRNVDAAFHTTILRTSDGRSLSGLELRTEGEVLILADNRGKELRVATEKIEERRKSPISPMPANVSELVKEHDFPHLLGYLMAQRQKEP